MTEQRKKLINKFQSWLDTDPRKQIISAQCANIAEEYAKEQLLLHNVSQQRELCELLMEDYKKILQIEVHNIVDRLQNGLIHPYTAKQEIFKSTLKAINYTHSCKSDSELLPTGYTKCNCSNAKDKLDCGFECYNK